MILREAITKIVPMLSQQQVRVTLRGMKAFVDFDAKTHQPIRVNLPYLPDDASDELIDAVQGFLDHEVGHILFSDPAEIARANKVGKAAAFLHNAIEDPMIAEKKMQDQFTGCAYNLSNVRSFFLKRMVDKNLSEAIANGDEKKITAALMVPAIRAWAGQEECIDYMEGKWPLIDTWVKSVGQDLIDAVPLVDNSEQACSLAIKMHARIGEEPPPENPPPEESSPEEQPAPSDPGEEGEPQPAPGGEEGEPEEAPASPPSKPGPGEGESEEAPGSAPATPSEPGEEEGEPGTTPVMQATMNTEFRDDLLAAINKQNGFDESVAEALSERAQQDCANSDYLIFTRDDDLIEPMPFTPRAEALIPTLQSKVDEMLGPLTNEIERMIKARSAAIWTGGHRSGRLHGASLARVTFNRDDVFRRKQENKTKDVAVMQLGDISGSMCSDEKIETAMYSMYAVASILDRLGISNEAMGFTTRGHSPEVQNDLRADPKRSEYCRYEALYMPVFKSFNERVGADTRARFIQPTISGNLCRSNVDGESVMLAFRRLAARRETRKIMLVYSDGNPAVSGGGNLDDHLKAVVRQIEASGTDIVGLGIMDRSVGKFYKKHVIMKSVKDLPLVVTGELKHLLTK